jgi:hypothetical protein
MHHVSDLATDPSTVTKGGGRGGSMWDHDYMARAGM